MGGAAITFGADCFVQFTTWPTYLAAMQRAESLGYGSLWTPDHVLPSSGSTDGPVLESYTALAGVAASTTRATLGLLVSPVPLRNPAMVTKMVTTIDHISDGRAVLGLGAGWAGEEFRQYGEDFGDGFGERLRWLREALPVVRGMLEGTRPTAAGPRYAMQEVTNAPAPVNPRLPLLIGGMGEQVTLRLVAEFADMCNFIGPPEVVAHKEAVLLGHCDAVGRDPAEIERSVAVRQPIIRDDRGEAEQVLHEVLAHNGIDPGFGTPGTVDEFVDLCRGYVELGYRHLIFQFLAPVDDETMTRLMTEVHPALAAA